MRHADAPMRGAMADVLAFMERYARPGDALHERHRRAAVDIGPVKDLLLDDVKDTERSRQAWHASRHRRIGDVLAVAVDMQLLLIDRNDDFNWPFRDIAER